MSPSTVQTSRFSFFSREAIFAFAPCNTASTRAIESFQRNPKGGTNSSAAWACGVQRKQAISVPKTSRRIIGRFQAAMHVKSRPAISVSFACICNSLSVFPSAPGGGKLRAEPNAVNSGKAHESSSEISSLLRLRTNPVRLAREIFAKRLVSSFSPAHARSIFLVKKIFSSQLKIKFIFFLSLSQWISSLKPAGEGSHKAHVNKL